MNKYSKGYKELKESDYLIDAIKYVFLTVRRQNRKSKIKLALVGVSIFILLFLMVYAMANLAKDDVSAKEVMNNAGQIKKIMDQSAVNSSSTPSDLESFGSNWEKIGKRQISAFTSTPNQTDSSPCIAAGGDICKMWLEGTTICATNEFSIGTELFLWGDIQGSCIVMDRTNARYDTLIDLYLGFDRDCLDDYHPGDDCPNLREAQKFGLKEIEVEKCNNCIYE